MRKWSDRVNSKHLAKALAGLAGLSILSVVFFQNCTPVNVGDMTEEARLVKEHIAYVGAGEAVVEVGASQYDKASAGFDVGLDSVPPLKQFWIVDNSGTMEANNLNLSNSFGAMFNQNNQDSLFKFDTTAYLLSTAQTIPSYSSSSRGVITDIASLQSVYSGPASVSQTAFNSTYRTSTLNSGQLPGDNVGIYVKANSATDFAINAAPVLGSTPGAPFALSTSIRKPRNTNTADFENDFQARLSVLTSKRVPSSIISGVDTQQSAAVIDNESGLCAMARVLDNPNGLYSSSDLLAFTVVSDENENDVSGKNCLKRTAYQQGDVDLVNGRCAEFETSFSYATRNRDASTCAVSGSAGYRADFSYLYKYANISYYYAKTAASIVSTTPQTKISWKTPTTKKTYQQQRTSIRYYTQKTVAATYKYEARRIPVAYYLPVCTTSVRDGIQTTTCVAAATVSNGFVEGSAYTTCNAAARSLASNAIIATTDTIPSSKLPSCGTPVFQVVTSCNDTDTTNCKKTMLTASSIVIDKGPLDTYLVGDQSSASACKTGALGLDANAVTATSANIAADKLPVCQAASWVTLTGASTCTASSTCQVTDSAGTPADGSQIVLGTIANGSAACNSNAAVPANAIAGSVTCAAATALQTSVACTSAQTSAGCTSTNIPETKEMSSLGPVAGITSLTECQNWVNGQSNNRTDASHPIVCDLKDETRKVSATRTFVQVSNNSLQVADACGATATTFYNALSANDKNLLGTAGASSDCKIGAITAGSASTRTLTAANCAAQLAADCSALNYRDCTSTGGGGGFTAAFSAPTPHSIIKMKDINCSSKCKDLPAGACEGSSTQDITFAQFLTNKFGGDDKQVQCSSGAATEKAPAISTVSAQPLSNAANFCVAAEDGTRRYFVQVGAAFRTQGYTDEFVAGNSDDGKSPRMDLIQFIKNKIESNGLNVNLTVFIRRSQDPDGVGSGINYKGVDYEKLVQLLSTPDSAGRAPASGQVYSVLAPSYSDALTSLSAELKSKLIRSFTIPGLQLYQVITSVKITSTNGSVKNLQIGQWTQSGKVITVANGIDLQEGDKIAVEYQNDDGYIRAQLKKIFIIDQMRPEQIVKSVEHIKADGTVVVLTQDQWLKDGNKIVIDPTLVINGGDKFRIKFQNDVPES